MNKIVFLVKNKASLKVIFIFLIQKFFNIFLKRKIKSFKKANQIFLKNKKIFPEISGGRHLIVVRFFENVGDDNYQQYQENVDFKISLC